MNREIYIAVADPIQNGDVIYGIGISREAALRDATQNGADSDNLITMPCDSELYEYFEQNGGANIDWIELDDVATINPDPR